MTYIPKSVRKPQGNSSPGASAPKDPNVTIVRVEDILSSPQRNSKGVMLEGSFVMKPNATMIQIYMTPSTIDAGYSTEGDEDAEQFKHVFKGDHPGSDLEIDEFIQNNTGKDLVIIYGSCTEKVRRVMGSKCAPMKLKTEGVDNKDGRKKQMTFEQIVATGYVPAHYMGEIVLQDPTLASGAALTISNESLMQKLPSSSTDTDITFTAITADVDNIVTLIGSGGTTPSVLEPSANIVLNGGANWTAVEGAVIHLKVYNGATKMLIEVSRE